MRRGIVHSGAWAAATGAAVILSWFGVHLVLAAGHIGVQSTIQVPQTGLPGDAVSPEASSTMLPQGQLGPATARALAPSTSASPGSGQTGRVRSYSVTGGRAALEMRSDSADLVSATPEQGWEMQVWHGSKWLRVDFTKGSTADSVFVTWEGHPPTVQLVNR